MEQASNKKIAELLKELKQLKAENKALKNKLRYNELIGENTADNIAILSFDLNGTYLYVSPSVKQLLGYESEEMLGHSAFEFLHPDDKKEILPLLQQYLKNIAQKAIRTNDSNLTERLRFRFKNKAGDWLHLESTVNFMGRKLLSVTRDITKQVQMEERLKKSELRYRLLFDSLPFGGEVVSPDGVVVECSKNNAEMLGYRPSEIIGKHITSFVAEESKETFRKLFPLLMQGKPQKAKIKMVRKDGSLLDVVRAAQPILDENGNVEAVLAISMDITEQEKIRVELQKSEDKFHKAFEISPDAMSISCLSDGHYVEVNNGLLSILDYTKEELIGKSSVALHIWHDPKERNKLVKIIKEKRSVTNFEARFRMKNGTVLTGLLSASIIDLNGTPHLLCVTRDITDIKKAEEALVKLSAVVTQSPTEIVITDLEGYMEYVNPKFTDLTGFTAEEVKGKKPNVVKSGYHPDVFYKELWNTITAGKTWKGELYNKKKDGTLFWEAAVISPVFDKHGEIVNFVKIAQDITRRKIMELELQKQNEDYAALNEEYQTVNEELRATNEKLMANFNHLSEINQQLEEALARAEESDRLKTAFLHNMSHEIRTPMNGIMGFADLLSNPELKEEQQQYYLEVIRKAGQRLLNTIDDLLKISMIESGQVALCLQEVRLHDVIQEMLLFFSPEAEQKGLKLSADPSPEDIRLETDKDKLLSVLTNLIKNAIKYTPEGSVEIGYEQEGGQVKFFVKDTGIGIPKERHVAVFDRFVQADIADRRAFEGNGLGLSISKAYVELMGGKIWVESEPESGSCFYFTIPINDYKKEKERKREATTAPTIEKIKGPYNLLVVEDDNDSAQYLSVILKPVAGKMIRAVNGEEAIQMLKEHPDTEVVLMDMKMPVMNGYETTKEIRKFNKQVVILAQTAYAFPEDKEKALAAGCNDYISKPFTKQDVLDMIEKHVGN